MPTKERFQFGCLGASLLSILLGAAALVWGWRGAGGSASIHWPGLRELISLNYSHAPGIVVRSGSFGMPASRGGVYPIVRFEVRGKSYEFKGTASDSAYLTPGTQVTVTYRTDDPTEAHIRGIGQMVPTLFVTGAGVLLVGGGLVVIAFVFRSNPKSPKGGARQVT
jgi:hypothetical protein